MCEIALNFLLSHPRNINGCTPIHLAAMNGYPTVVEFLIEHSPKDSVEILDNDHVSQIFMHGQSRGSLIANQAMHYMTKFSLTISTVQWWPGQSSSS